MVGLSPTIVSHMHKSIMTYHAVSSVYDYFLLFIENGGFYALGFLLHRAFGCRMMS
jgi:hypothetical protein